jgi:hypothetical protein
MTAFAGNRRLKILFLSQRFLYPMDTGGKIRTGKILEHLYSTLANEAANGMPWLKRSNAASGISCC